MPTVSFPYHLEKLDGTVVLKPKIPVKLRNYGKELEVLAVVDSGADVSLIDLHAANS